MKDSLCGKNDPDRAPGFSHSRRGRLTNAQRGQVRRRHVTRGQSTGGVTPPEIELRCHDQMTFKQEPKSSEEMGMTGI